MKMGFDAHYLFLLGAVLLSSVSQLLLKKGALQRFPSAFREYCTPWVIGGYLLLFCSMFLNIQGLRTLDYLNAPVMESLGYVLVPVLSALFFREKLSASRLVGIGCIVLGMVVFYL